MALIRLAAGADQATVDPDAGGRLASLLANGRERLRREPADDDDPAIGWGSFLMAPFVGRIAGGVVRWGGREAQLRKNWGAHAIHGVGYDVPWTVQGEGPDEVSLGLELDGSRWPFRGRLRQRYAIAPGQLTVEAEVQADEPMPAAAGWHPWFLRDGEVVRVAVPAEHVLDLGPDLIPTGRLRPLDERTDLRTRAEVAGRRLDDVYVAVGSPLVVCWPDLELHLELGASVVSAVVYTAPGIVCVEPMTAWPDAIRLEGEGIAGTGLVSLAPGERLVARTVWRWQAISPGAEAAASYDEGGR